MKGYSVKAKHDSEIHRTTRLARSKRDFIFDQLGRICANSECRSQDKLEFDVIIPDLEKPKGHHWKMSFCQRMNFYLAELKKENLQVLCAPCNGRKQDKENYAPY
jgi:hypothetical protein